MPGRWSGMLPGTPKSVIQVYCGVSVPVDILSQNAWRALLMREFLLVGNQDTQPTYLWWHWFIFPWWKIWNQIAGSCIYRLISCGFARKHKSMEAKKEAVNQSSFSCGGISSSVHTSLFLVAWEPLIPGNANRLPLTNTESFKIVVTMPFSSLSISGILKCSASGSSQVGPHT